MGQKSRSKKNRPQQNQAKKQVSPIQATARPSQPSLVKSSATYQPTKAAAQSEDTMQVRSVDIHRILWLLAIMAVLLVVLGIVNSHSQILHQGGVKLTSLLRIGN